MIEGEAPTAMAFVWSEAVFPQSATFLKLKLFHISALYPGSCPL